MFHPSRLQSAAYDIEYFQRAGVCRLCWASDATRDLHENAPNSTPAKASKRPNSSSFESYTSTKSATPKENDREPRKKNLMLKIKSCLDIDIPLGLKENYPKRICGNCVSTVTKFYKYKVFCQQADRKLKQIYSERKSEQQCDFVEVEIKTEQASESFLDAYNDFNSTDSTDNQPLFNLKTKPEFLDVPEDDVPIEISNDNFPPKKVKLKSNLERDILNSEHLVKCTRKPRSPTYCNICHSDYGTDFADHNRDAHGIDIKSYSCFGCDKRFISSKSRLCHETKFCKGLKEGYRCAACARHLPSRRAYETHQREHRAGRAAALPDQPFRCAPCGKAFVTRANLHQHNAVHEKKRNFVCEMCGRVFTRRDYLRKHIHTHTGQKQYVCPHCGFRATQKSSLTVHIRKHTGERPFSCEICGQKCVSSSNLLAHRRRHDGLKKFECTICGKKFGYKLSLEEHMASSHERLRTHACRLCGATYSRQRGLRRHARVKHAANYDGCGALEEFDSQNGRADAEFGSERNGQAFSNDANEGKCDGVEGFLNLERTGESLNSERANDGLKHLNAEQLNLNVERPIEVGFLKSSNLEQSERSFFKSLTSENEQGILKGNSEGTASTLEGHGGLVKDESLKEANVERPTDECRPNQWIFLGAIQNIQSSLT